MPISPYMLFIKLNARNPAVANLSFIERGKRLGELYKTLSPSERETLVVKAKSMASPTSRRLSRRVCARALQLGIPVDLVKKEWHRIMPTQPMDRRMKALAFMHNISIDPAFEKKYSRTIKQNLYNIVGKDGASEKSRDKNSGDITNATVDQIAKLVSKFLEGKDKVLVSFSKERFVLQNVVEAPKKKNRKKKEKKQAEANVVKKEGEAAQSSAPQEVQHTAAVGQKIENNKKEEKKQTVINNGSIAKENV